MYMHYCGVEKSAHLVTAYTHFIGSTVFPTIHQVLYNSPGDSSCLTCRHTHVSALDHFHPAIQKILELQSIILQRWE